VTKLTWLLLAGVGLAVIAAGVTLAVFDGTGSVIPREAMAAPRYLDEAAAAGVVHTYDGNWNYYVGGGVAAFDCNADRKPDLFFAGGAEPAALYRNESEPGGPLRFAHEAGAATDLGGVTGAYPVDIDSDGVTDLAVLRFGENVLLRGRGDCKFERANESWAFDGGDVWSTAFSATWEANAAMPTLAVGNYVALDEDGNQHGACSDNVFLRPEAGGYADATPLAPGWCTLSILFSDWNRSGESDLRVSNDKHYYRDGEEQLWRIEAGSSPALYTREEGWRKMQIWGMGIASHDITGDGLPEVVLTSQGDNKMQSLTEGPSQPTYGDIAIRRGGTAHRPFTGGDILPSTAWHPEFQDVNNDGFVDLYMSKGNVDAVPEFAAKDPNNLMLGQPDGSFVEGAEAAGIVHYGRTRGAALVDLNLDGMLDLVEVNRVENVRLWRNVGWGDARSPVTMGNWLAVDVEQSGTNRDAVGAWIELDVGGLVMSRELTVGGGHVGGQLGWVHFGLGPSPSAHVRVIWPDGEVGPWLDVEANRFVTLHRGGDSVEIWEPQG
jgi:hypothetical protein